MQLNVVDQTTTDLPKVNSESFLVNTSFAGIVSECSKMNSVFAVIQKVAKTNSTVLVLGESGTGKELVARALHHLSGRKGKLVPVNCGAIPEEILESELFGHEKGAFTGAVANKVGRFQHADGGTIFLDEIAEMSPKLQVKLLRVLQEKKVEPVGSTRSIPVDVRIVAATNKDLREEVKAGRFREDLYYRLQVVPISLPPLRARGADVALLTDFFMARACENLGIETVEFSPEARDKFNAYSWPGNVRELENLIERLAILAEGKQINLQDLPDYILGHQQDCTILEIGEFMPDAGVSFNELVDQFESKLITMALDKTGWNKKAAAELLNLNRTTLVEKIKKKGLAQEIEVVCDNDPIRPF
ncbi:MAG: sigma-54-dependent Fis family transcriptional regulator [Bdellovibrionales bacterium]|nr:sigma-54-dependent Fis family transcriptional regulator [Bdellovibrionales bacterium]